MALSRAQHEANKANGSYRLDKWGNVVPPKHHGNTRHTDVYVSKRSEGNSLGLSSSDRQDPLKVQIATLRACGRQAEANRLAGIK